MGVTFTDKAFEAYIAWQSEDKKTLKKINALIKSIKRDGLMSGLGHPEPLKWRKGYSRHIDDKNRLAYDSDNNHNIIIISCKGHYDEP
jgi:toxin YoeB